MGNFSGDFIADLTMWIFLLIFQVLNFLKTVHFRRLAKSITKELIKKNKKHPCSYEIYPRTEWVNILRLKFFVIVQWYISFRKIIYVVKCTASSATDSSILPWALLSPPVFSHRSFPPGLFFPGLFQRGIFNPSLFPYIFPPYVFSTPVFSTPVLSPLDLFITRSFPPRFFPFRFQSSLGSQHLRPEAFEDIYLPPVASEANWGGILNTKRLVNSNKLLEDNSY